ncbi:MAG: nucleotidyltransferase family protein [Sphingomonadales bacterium]|nr:nucleotidyltransferase family protein [Sphingomonadales bacterium]
MMDLPRLKRLLLAMAGTACPPTGEALRALVPADWQALDTIAARHRLQPLLHAAWQGSPAVPEAVRQGWRAVHRDWAMAAMVQRADMLETVALLRADGIEPLVLKGGWLAWHAYPEAALRPMRDIDMLVPQADYVRAMRLLEAQGFALAEEPEMAWEDMLLYEKSFAPFIVRRGTAIEVHQHAWHREGRLEYPSPAPDDAGLFARSRIGPDGLRYPAAEDMLAHLVIHAVYSHRLDCGPLLLSDIDFLLQREVIDWPGFWARAEAQGWRRGARLVFELVQRWRAPAGLDLAVDCGDPLPPELVEASADLMLQDLDTRLSAGFAAATLAGGPRTLLRRLRARDKVSETGDVARITRRSGGYLGWAWSRLRRTAGDLLHRETRAQARDMTRFTRWLSQ